MSTLETAHKEGEWARGELQMSTTNAKVLDLRGLSATERDARVNEAVALMAGWTVVQSTDFAGYYHSVAPGTKNLSYTRFSDRRQALLLSCPPYATSCDAVRVLEIALPKEQRNRYINLLNGIHAEEEIDAVELDFRWCTSSALHRCIALLRANGWEVLT